MDIFREEPGRGPLPTPLRSADPQDDLQQQLAQPMDVEPTPPAPPPTAAANYTLLTAPPIPWPQPALAPESLQLGGRYWPSVTPSAFSQAIRTGSSSPASAPPARTTRDEYLQALYLPESVYALADLVQTLAGATAVDLVPVALVSAKHRKVLPALLPSLFSANPPHTVRESSLSSTAGSAEPTIDELEWRAFRSGFGVRLGSKGLGGAAKGVEGESEEARNERRRAEEELWVREGREWVEGLERREVLVQVLLHFLLPPPPNALSAAALPKKRSRKPSKAPSSSSTGPVDLAQSLMAYADRLSIWQALSSLGVDALSLSTPKGKERADAQPAAATAAKRDWVQAFYADVLEPRFGTTHPGFCHILTSTLQLPAALRAPRPVKATPSRPLAPAGGGADDARPNPTPPTPVVWPPVPAAGVPSAASRRKGKAKQLPDDANKYVLAAANASSAGGSGGPGARMAHSMSRTHSLASTSASSSAGGNSRAFARSASSAVPTAKASATERGKTAAATILERAASLGPAASIKQPVRANSLGPSLAPPPAAGNSGASSRSGTARVNSFARTSSQGPETQTEKLMRRSVSFTKGAGVGRKPAGGSAAAKDKAAAASDGAGGSQTKLDGLWGARVSKANAGEEKGAGGPGRPGGARRESLPKSKSSGSRLHSSAPSPPKTTTSAPQTLVPETPVKAAPSRSLVPDTPTGPMPAFVAETPPAPSAPAALLGKAYKLGAAAVSGGAGWALGRVMEGGEEDGLGEFFEEGSDGE